MLAESGPAPPVVSVGGGCKGEGCEGEGIPTAQQCCTCSCMAALRAVLSSCQNPPPPPPQLAGTAPNHALLLVGYSTQTAGQEHFLAKNSLGAGWGEAGFVRLAMAGDGAGLCGMYRAAYQPAAVVIVGPGKPGNGNA